MLVEYVGYDIGIDMKDKKAHGLVGHGNSRID